MKIFHIFVIFNFYQCINGHQITIEDILEKNGYPPLETHFATTDDGYILRLHRIPFSKIDEQTSNNRGPPVLLLHTMFSSSIDWLIQGPGKSLGFILSDAGYDVWLGNIRGNFFSRNHTVLDPDTDKRAFWNFSYNEMGIYDIPAMIDKVLLETSNEKLTFVGWGTGFTAFAVMGSQRPQYNDKILLANVFSPVTDTFRVASNVIKITKIFHDIFPILEKLGIYEILTHKLSPLITAICDVFPIGDLILCPIIFNQLGYSFDEMNTTLIPVVAQNVPTGISTKLYQHYVQTARSGHFHQFDYGTEKNLAYYHSKQPPEYDLSQISAPIYIYWGEKDNLVNIQILLGQVVPTMKNATAWKIPIKDFNHLDPVWGKDVALVNQKVLDNINLYNNRK